MKGFKEVVLKEEWKNILGYEGLYLISNLGEVKSLPRKGAYKNPYILKQAKSTAGYFQVCLSKNSKMRTKQIHRLVAEHFVINNDKSLEVNHIDGNKENNHSSNLEWITKVENQKHAARLGLKARGKRQHSCKLTEAKVLKIRQLYKSGSYTYKLLSNMFSVHIGTIQGIIQRRHWKYI